MAKQGTKGNKHKFQGRNNGPSRQKYWASGRLQERKVTAIMAATGKTRAEATIEWLDNRQGRMKRGGGGAASGTDMRPLPGVKKAA